MSQAAENDKISGPQNKIYYFHCFLWGWGVKDIYLAIKNCFTNSPFKRRSKQWRDKQKNLIIFVILTFNKKENIKPQIKFGQWYMMVVNLWIFVDIWKFLFTRFSCSGLFQRDDRQTDKQTNRQTDKQTNRQTDKQTNRQTDKQTNRQTDKQTFSVCHYDGPTITLWLSAATVKNLRNLVPWTVGG